MTSLKEFQRLLETHDWDYQHSDDPKEYARGEANAGRLKAIAATDPQLQKMLTNFRRGA